MRLGYNTNGFAHHRLDDALEIIAETGYRGVALTPDVHHLPPLTATSAEIAEVRRQLERLDLAVVVETGARFVLDPRRKQRPNLVEREADGRQIRLDMLIRCARIAAELGANTLSLWSGVLPGDADADEAWNHLADGVARICDEAGSLGLTVAFEPEPGMFIQTLAGWDRLHAMVPHPALGLTLDVGHIPCTESIDVPTAIDRYRDHLRNVHLDDTRGSVHDHRQIGEGDLDFGAILAALRGVDFAGVASVELSRHSHAAPQAAQVAFERLRSAETGE